jgi:hypothetical protein
MAEKTVQKQTIAEALAKNNKIEFGSEAHQRLLEAAYGMTVEKAKTIIEERKKNPQTWPYELYEKAENMLQALATKPVAIDKDPGWHRERAEV